LGKRSSVAVSWIGKVKTTAQMVALALQRRPLWLIFVLIIW
ncbi:CDP-diacylglycerol--glycerol-3-phosphate 3-phosphatidyltransferase, partial [Escherichia sp. R-CC3]